MKKVLRIALYYFLIAIFALPVFWYVYEVYFVDHRIHYHECGGALPISVPFDVSKKGASLSCRFKVDQDVNHQISLRYFYDGNVSKVTEIAGHGRSDPGETGAIIRYKLLSPDHGHEIKSGTVDKFIVHMAYEDSSVGEITNAKLRPGEYEVYLESINGSEKLKNVRTDLYIDLSPISK